MGNFILGAGMTGLAAGIVSGLPVYEAVEAPGGICSSYYVRPGDSKRLNTAPENGEAYRFELGGGHWIFGGDPLVLRFIRSLTAVKSYTRKSSVHFPEKELYVPYPIQNHLRYLDSKLAVQALGEMVEAAAFKHPVAVMKDWLRASFGRTLCELFFDPFHELYTAGLWKSVVSQDAYKSPVNLSLAIQGTFNEAPPVGYNATFIYPIDGLNMLAQRMAERCNIHYGKRVTNIDVGRKEVHFADGSVNRYETLISTLPLNHMIEMTRLTVNAESDPSTSVLVINIGAIRGPNCPQDHWVYIPKTKARFHRVGFYSNVDSSFLPESTREDGQRVSIYVEKAYVEGQKLSKSEVSTLCRNVVQELMEWGWIKDAEVVDPTWIDVAYTWSRLGSRWKQEALRMLDEYGIYQVGRYARWVFQGIADSIRDGFIAGGSIMQR
jgi:protoporphyrinogen oxidase